jgi:hypothetical protein
MQLPATVRNHYIRPPATQSPCRTALRIGKEVQTEMQVSVPQLHAAMLILTTYTSVMADYTCTENTLG